MHLPYHEKSTSVNPYRMTDVRFVLFPFAHFADLDALTAAFGEDGEDLRAVEVIDALHIGALAEVDRVELAACGADTAAKALVRIHEGRAATKAACRLFLHLLFGEGQSVIR